MFVSKLTAESRRAIQDRKLHLRTRYQAGKLLARLAEADADSAARLLHALATLKTADGKALFTASQIEQLHEQIWPHLVS
jgi:hypothetical protein